MNTFTAFDFKETPVRVVTIEDAPWWVVSDVCRAIDIQNPRDVLKRLDEDDVDSSDVIDGMGRAQKMNVVNEPGLYDLILRSDKPEAREFKRWITREVLPSLRRTGSYQIGAEPEPERLTREGVVELDLGEVFELSKRGAAKLLHATVLGAAGAQALGLLVQECRKIYELRLRLSPADELPMIEHRGDPAIEQILIQAASAMVGSEWVRLQKLWQIARQLKIKGLQNPNPDQYEISRLGAMLSPWLERELLDTKGRAFRVSRIKVQNAKAYRFEFIAARMLEPVAISEEVAP